MILGIGSDVLEVSRVERELARHGAFVPGEVFTAAEVAAAAAARRPAEHLGARFAAKEAFLKALGAGAPDLGAFAEVEVIDDPGETPCLRLHGAVRAEAARRGVTRIFLSLSHTPEVASALVVLEQDPSEHSRS